MGPKRRPSDARFLISQQNGLLARSTRVEMWDKLASSVSNPVGAIRTRAYAQAARDQASALGC